MAPEALGLMLQVMGKLEDHVTDKDLVSIHAEDVILQAGLHALVQQIQHVPAGQREAFEREVVQLGQRVGALHLAADLRRQDEAEGELRLVQATFTRIEAYFPRAILTAAQAAADRYTCPVHSDIQGKKTDHCSKCGQALEQEIRLLPEFCGFPVSSGSSLTATVRVDRPLVAGEPALAVLKLARTDASAVYPSDLMVTHTERIHLLLIDAALSDFHHEHPQYSGVPGEFTFRFTPRSSGNYRAWAEVRPQPMGLQEYLPTLVPGSSTNDAPGVLRDRTPKTSATAGGLRCELLFATNRLDIARPIIGRLRVSQSDGTPYTQLEPVMDAFAHLVGFYEDGRSVLHVHPKGPGLLGAKARGGPELEFQFYTTRRGYVRLFAQIRAGGELLTLPFGIPIGTAF
jgi:heavy metal-binding protein